MCLDCYKFRCRECKYPLVSEDGLCVEKKLEVDPGACPKNCATCYSESEFGECKECYPGYLTSHRLDDLRCVEKNCPSKCLDCYKYGCTECEYPNFLRDGECVDPYHNETVVTTLAPERYGCPSNCQNCFEGKQCNQCYPGYLQSGDPKDLKCSQSECNHLCYQCYKYKCTECEYPLQLKNGKCVDE